MKFIGLIGLIALWAACGTAQAKYTELSKNHCGIYYSTTYTHLQLHKAFATSNGGTPSPLVACGWGAHWGSKSAAISEALKDCRKHRVDGVLAKYCKVVDAK